MTGAPSLARAPARARAREAGGIPCIDTLTAPPEIGKFYLVPTVHYLYCESDRIWPVIGPKHTDAEIIDFPEPHYHVDARFLDAAQARVLNRYSKWRKKFLAFDGPALALTVAGAPIAEPRYWGYCENARPLPGIVYRRRCARIIPYVNLQARWHVTLRRHYAGARLIQTEHGLICPHKGAPIGSVAPDERGLIVCPLHGLCFDPITLRAVAEPKAARGPGS